MEPTIPAGLSTTIVNKRLEQPDVFIDEFRDHSLVLIYGKCNFFCGKTKIIAFNYFIY